MKQDMTVPCEDGFINIRVGAIIMKDGKLLMVGNSARPEYLYSVGGRVKFGETAEEAVVREVYEETGVRLEPDRLGFVHESRPAQKAGTKAHDGQSPCLLLSKYHPVHLLSRFLSMVHSSSSSQSSLSTAKEVSMLSAGFFSRISSR